jgi:hypothetical protein
MFLRRGLQFFSHTQFRPTTCAILWLLEELFKSHLFKQISLNTHNSKTYVRHITETYLTQPSIWAQQTNHTGVEHGRTFCLSSLRLGKGNGRKHIEYPCSSTLEITHAAGDQWLITQSNRTILLPCTGPCNNRSLHVLIKRLYLSCNQLSEVCLFDSFLASRKYAQLKCCLNS